MRLLLLETITGSGDEVETRYPPLGLAYLAAYVRSHCDVDPRIFTASAREVPAIVRQTQPDIVGIASVTQNFDEAVISARAIKAWRDVPVIVGGHHITAIPESLDEHMDIAVLGEGEQTLQEVVIICSEGGLSPDALSKVNGIAFRRDGRLVITPHRPPVENLDSLPIPARDLLHIRGDEMHMLTSRGCPYRCAFCSSSHFWGGVRFHSAERVVAEISEIVAAYSPSRINIYDDLFAANKKRLRQIACLLEQEDFMSRKEVAFSCLARADAADAEIVGLLKRINVTDVAFGLESGADRVLKRLKGGPASVRQNMRAVGLFKKAGMRVVGSFIMGSPTETLEDAQATLSCIRELRLDGGEAYLAVPYPGTRLWDHAQERKLIPSNVSWSSFCFSPRKNPLVLTDQISPGEVLGLLEEANWLLSCSRAKGRKYSFLDRRLWAFFFGGSLILKAMVSLLRDPEAIRPEKRSHAKLHRDSLFACPACRSSQEPTREADGSE